MEGLEGGFELQSTAADVAWLGRDFDWRVGRNQLSGLGCLLAVHQDFARHDQGLCFFARLGEAAFHDCAVEACFASSAHSSADAERKLGGRLKA